MDNAQPVRDFVEKAKTEQQSKNRIMDICCTIAFIVVVSFLLFLAVNHDWESGATHDARVQATKQAIITECSGKGMYPVLDPNYATAVYCSAIPVVVVR